MTTDAPPPTRRALRTHGHGVSTDPDGLEPDLAAAAVAPETDRNPVAAVDAAFTPVPALDALAVDADEPAPVPADEHVPAAHTREPGIDAAPIEPARAASAPAAQALRADAPAADPEPVPDPEPAATPAEAPAPAADPEPAVTPDAATQPAPVVRTPTALIWLDETRVAAPAAPVAATPERRAAGPDLLAGAPRRSLARPSVLVPIGMLVLLLVTYVVTTLLWPLYAIPPRIEATTVTSAAAPAAAPAWPAQGTAAISVAGIDGALASSADASSIASITKVVTALVILDRLPLSVGESGPEYRFTAADRTRYWQYRDRGESALDVPVDGTLTQYQLLEGILIGSANNYADRLASTLWPSDAVFSRAAQSWLDAHGIPGITIVDPTGIEPGNAAAPESLLPLAARAMADPVISEIVRKQAVELPGAGVVENTNALLAEPGFVGVKTGSLDAFNLLSAKDVAFGDTTVRMYAAVLGQPDPGARDDATRALFAQLEQELQPQTAVPAGTAAGRVVTLWGETVDVVTAQDAAVILWNGASANAAPEFSLGDAATAGAPVGALTVAGPLDRVSVELELADDVEGPSPWWRLTHPLDLFGLNG